MPCYFKSGDDYECNFTANGYRLPDEIEWFYAAIGGKIEEDDNGDIRHSKYSGSNYIDSVAWYRENSNGEPHEVMSKKPNELGLYDMSGNVWEWCSDWYDSYSNGAQTNPTGSSQGQGHVIRGGSWFYSSKYQRVSTRLDGGVNSIGSNMGLRLVMSQNQ